MKNTPLSLAATFTFRSLLLLLFPLLLFTTYRTCTNSTPIQGTSGTPKNVVPKRPGGGGGGIAILSLKQAPKHVRRMIEHLKSAPNRQPRKDSRAAGYFATGRERCQREKLTMNTTFTRSGRACPAERSDWSSTSSGEISTTPPTIIVPLRKLDEGFAESRCGGFTVVTIRVTHGRQTGRCKD